jgi:hypothetical protein
VRRRSNRQRSRRRGHRSEQPAELPRHNLGQESERANHHQGQAKQHPNNTFEIQFFKNPEVTNGGKTLVGSKRLTTDASGNASFTFSTKKAVALGTSITATATKNSMGDTSEFSAPRKVVGS